jgi:hypothetical protein
MLQGPIRRTGGDLALYRACIAIHQRMWRDHPWRGDRVVDSFIAQAAQQPIMMADVPALVTAMEEFRAALVPQSAAMALFGLAESTTFGEAGMISLRALDDIPEAVWIREGAPIPVVMGLSSLISLVPHKLATIIPLTNEMMRSSNAEVIMRQALIDNIGPALDRYLFDDQPGVPGLRPPGLLNGVQGLTGSTTAGNEGMTQDLLTLVAALAPYAGNGSIAFVASPAMSVRMKKIEAGGTTYPVLVANQPNLIAIATRALAVAIDPPLIDASSQAVFHEEDTNPLPIVDDAGVMASPVRSAWQTDSVGLRFRLPVSWGLRAPAVAWLAPGWATPTP